MINPVVEPLSAKKTQIWERCLSLPGLYGYVPRHNEIRLTFTDLDGVRHERIAKGWHAMLIQHECDHLDGVLYPMRIRDFTRFGFNEALFPGQALSAEE
jgi:peptide deformylase